MEDDTFSEDKVGLVTGMHHKLEYVSC